MMKIKNKVLAATLAAVISVHASVFANPTCVLMKFTDDTRFDRTESANTISDMVMEKLLNSGKFNFKETKVIDNDMERLLYEERREEFINAREAMESGDYDVLFDSPGFNEKRAQTIASAHLGQIVSPNIVREIGDSHGAEYLIQGTVNKIGAGKYWDDTTTYLGLGKALLSSSASTFAGIVGAVDIDKSIIGVRTDIRIIKASNGEVVWQKQFTGKATKTKVGISFIKIGSTKLDSEMYFKALDDTATKISTALIEDLEAGKLFL